MKKALVFGLICMVGFAFAGYAQTFSGEWETSVSIFPGATVFADFISGFSSAVDFEYSLAGWVFGIETGFGVNALTGFDISVDGTLGAFTIDADIDFAPRIVTATKTIYEGLAFEAGCLDIVGVTWTKKTVTDTVTAGFDDMTLDVSVSIAGVSFGALMLMEGNDNEVNVTYNTFYGDIGTAGAYTAGAITGLLQTASYTIVDGTKYGVGYKLSMGGSFGAAAVSIDAYFNVTESALTYVGHVADNYPFVKSGSYSLACTDCVVRFTSFDAVITGLNFGCTELSASATFNCCGFDNFKFLVENVELGLGWALEFDLLITFSATNKTVQFEPDFTIENLCFAIDAELLYSPTSAQGGPVDGVDITGIEIDAISFSYDFGGVTFSAEHSWDVARREHPIWGTYGYVASPTSVYVWEPDLDMQVATFTYDADLGTCVPDVAGVAVIDTGLNGYWQLKAIPCEKATAWEKYSLAIDGDSCCGGLFDLTADFYMGDVVVLSDIDGSYYFNATDGTTWTTTTIIYGSALTGTEIPTRTAWTDSAVECDPCPSGDCSFAVDAVAWDIDYVAKSNNRLFDWLRTDVSLSFGIDTNLDVEVGFDVNLWGWSELSAGFTFTF